MGVICALSNITCLLIFIYICTDSGVIIISIFFNHNKWFQRNTTLVSVYTKHQVINLVSCQSIYLYISCKKKVNNSSSCTFGMLPVFMVFMTINLKDLSFLLLWKFLRWFHIAICFDIECYVTYFILLFNNHLSNNSCIFQDCV